MSGQTFNKHADCPAVVLIKKQVAFPEMKACELLDFSREEPVRRHSLKTTDVKAWLQVQMMQKWKLIYVKLSFVDLVCAWTCDSHSLLFTCTC